MTFRSVHHPGSASRALVAARAQSGPVAFALLCVMVVALAAALQGYPVLKPLLFIVPGVYTAAAAVGNQRDVDQPQLVLAPVEVDPADGRAPLVRQLHI